MADVDELREVAISSLQTLGLAKERVSEMIEYEQLPDIQDLTARLKALNDEVKYLIEMNAKKEKKWEGGSKKRVGKRRRN